MPRKSSNHLIWIDLEMTGLNPDRDRIIEIATVITDKQLNILADGPVIAVHQNETYIQQMDEWNTKHHHQSGLIQRVRESKINEAEAETITLEFLAEYVSTGKSPICGNSICQDRRFLYRHMPKLEKYFHYRNLDVSTVKILARMWAPDVARSMKKKSTHTALKDIYDSIEEMRHYKNMWLT